MEVDYRPQIRHKSPSRTIAATAEAQFGLVSREQALAAGLKERAIARRLKGAWERVLPSVYRLRGVPRSWEQDVMAACLWAGPRSVASHLTAGKIWGLDGVEVNAVEVSVPRPQALENPAVVVHKTTDLPPDDRKVQRGLPVTSSARTLLDLAGVLEREALELALDDALRRHIVNVPWLRRILRRSGGSGRHGSAALTQLLDRHDRRGEATDSRLEARTLQLLRRASLPTPILHYDVCQADQRIAEVDFAYPKQRVAVQCDGRRYHDSDERWARDLGIDSELAAIGWRVIHVVWADMKKRPDQIVRWVQDALDAG